MSGRVALIGSAPVPDGSFTNSDNASSSEWKVALWRGDVESVGSEKSAWISEGTCVAQSATEWAVASDELTNSGFRPYAPCLRFSFFEILFVGLDPHARDDTLEFFLFSGRLGQVAVVLRGEVRRNKTSCKGEGTYGLAPLVHSTDENDDKGDMTVVSLVHILEVKRAGPFEESRERAGYSERGRGV